VSSSKRNRSIEFFDSQFRQQIRRQDYQLNPFETQALSFLKGTVLDLGCGLGNLSLEAGRRGHQVLAVDASRAAVERVNHDAAREGLPVKAVQADISSWSIDQSYDTIVAIGLLMFMRRRQAIRLLDSILEHVRLGGRVVLNVLIQGTTYMEMFDTDDYYLFPPDEIEKHLVGWQILLSRRDTFPAPSGTTKEFITVIAEKPGCRGS